MYTLLYVQVTRSYSCTYVCGYFLLATCRSGRHGGLVVSTLDFGSRGSGLSPGRVIVLCSWAKHFTLTVPLSTQEYKWVPAKYGRFPAMD